MNSCSEIYSELTNNKDTRTNSMDIVKMSTQSAITCSKLTIEAPEQGVKCAQN